MATKKENEDLKETAKKDKERIEELMHRIALQEQTVFNQQNTIAQLVTLLTGRQQQQQQYY